MSPQTRRSEKPKPDKTGAAAETAQASSDELLGELARDLSLLVRREMEVAAAQNAPQLRQLAIELAVATAAGAALLFALAGLSWAAVQGLSLAVPSWSASLIVAGAWAVVAALLVRLDHPRRLARRLTKEASEQSLEAAERKRDEAEEAVKATAERLGEAVARETVERELEAGFSAAEHLAAVSEDDVEDLLKELVVALLAPGRAGLSLLERIVGRQASA
jgi:hypothetical protein